MHEVVFPLQSRACNVAAYIARVLISRRRSLMTLCSRIAAFLSGLLTRHEIRSFAEH